MTARTEKCRMNIIAEDKNAWVRQLEKNSWDRTTETENLGQDSQERTGGEESQDNTARTGQPGEDSQERTGRPESDRKRKAGTWQWHRQPWQDSHDRTGGTGQLGQVVYLLVSQPVTLNRTKSTEWPGYDNKDITAHCGRRHSERYDNTGLFTVTYQLIYRYCTCTVQGCWNTSASLTAD
jgi:hypothetical protein